MSDKPRSRLTDFGFKFGAATVERFSSDEKGRVWIGITTARERVVIYVTPSGLIRVQEEEKGT